MLETRVRITMRMARIVIPAQLREALGVSAGDEIVLRMEDEGLNITTQKHRIKRAQQLLTAMLMPIAPFPTN